MKKVRSATQFPDQTIVSETVKTQARDKRLITRL